MFTTVVPIAARRADCQPNHIHLHMRILSRIAILALATALLPICGRAETKAPATTVEKVSYYTQVRPIFQVHCVGCHQPAKAKGGYVMTDFKRLLGKGDSDEPAVMAKHPEKSLLVEMITPVDGEAEMPQGKSPLSPKDIDLIKNWVKQGAVDDSPESAKQVYDMDNPPTYSQAPYVTTMDYSPNGKLIAVGGFNEVLIHKADGSALVKRLVGLSERIESVQFSPDGKLLAVSGGLPARQGELQIWDTASWKLKNSISVTYDTIYGAKWSPDNKHVAVGCADKTVRAFDIRSGKQVFFNAAHSDWALDTAWSAKGDKIISVGRDMSAKAYDFKTERFIDNLTSITPKALKGGLIAVASHPKLEEVLVGGSDGTPQIFRLERVAKRVIGDNSNLIRRYPPMEGRIFAVAYAPDGKTVVAGSSLNGKGHIHIYNANVKREVSAELKKVFGIRPASFKGNQRKMVEDYQTENAKLLVRASYAGGIYALTYSPDGATIAASGADGVLRLLDSKTLALKRAFVPVPLPEKQQRNVVDISISPNKVKVAKRYDYGQLLVTGWLASGETVDLTRKSVFKVSSDMAGVSPRGLVKPTKNGKADVTVSHGAYSAIVGLEAVGLDKVYQPDYVRDVMPVVSKLGCNAGTCHGAKDGKNGFKLSLRGYDPIYDVRAFADDLAGRRVNFARPEASLMLLKATSAVPHQGGGRTIPGSDYYNVVRDWIGNGCELNEKSPGVKSIEVFPRNPVVQDIGDAQQVRVIATYDNGEKRDVTAESFIQSSNQDIVKADETGLATTLRRGEAALLARFEGAYDATTLTVMGDRTGFVWQDQETWTKIDELVASKWKRMKILPSGLCTDAEFLRRIHLDLTGLPPTSDDVKKFLADKRPSRTKRNEVIAKLIGNEDFVDHWANKWADLLQVNRKFLGAEGAKLFRNWIRAEVKGNTPYDQFVSKIITAKGSNKINPPASYYKILRTPQDRMENTMHLFLATRFNCNKCHDHPFERWTQNQYYETAAYFAQVSLKRDPKNAGGNIGGTAVEGAKPLYEEIFDKTDGDITHERTGAITAPEFPYAAKYKADTKATRREKLAAWMTSPDNEYFAKSYANRIWGYLTGVGLIEPLDDIRAGNPPSNPELLNYLTAEFVKSDFNVRQLMKMIVESRAYQLSIKTHKWNEDDTVNFSRAIVRRLPAEVLYDTIHRSMGAKPNIPGVAAGTRAAQLPDSGIKLKDGFFATMGRPARESSCECERINDVQLGPVMAMISGATVGDAVSDPKNRIAMLVEKEKDDSKVVNEIFLSVLNRPATETEIKVTRKTIAGIAGEHKKLTVDMAAYEKKLKPITARKVAGRAKELKQSKDEFAAYVKSIAAQEKKRAEERDAKIAKADKSLKDYQKLVPKKQADFEKKQDLKTKWMNLDPAKIAASGGVKLTENKDLSISSSTNGAKTVYTITAETSLKNISSFRLETLTDKAMPKNGPGHATDGNFVVSEFEVFIAPKGDPKKMTKVALVKGAADFEQVNFTIGKAIDGKIDTRDGWAVSPNGGMGHWATFQAKDAIKNDKGSIITVKMHQIFQNKGTYRLGKFRLALAASPKPTGLSVSEELAALLKVPVAKRDDKQKAALAKIYAVTDKELTKRTKSLADAKKALTRDKKEVELENVVKRFEAPLPADPELTRLKRALKLSAEQLKKTRLVGMQDLAWALVNSPAFLFNH
jgi:WD40 repeat protein